MNKEYCQSKQIQAETYIIPQSNIDTSIMRGYGITTDEAANAVQRATEAVYKAMSVQEEVLYDSRKDT